MEEYIKYIIICILILIMDAIWIGNNIKMYGDAVKLVQKSEMVVRYHFVIIAYIIVLFSSIYISIPFTKKSIKKDDTIFDKLYKSFIYGGVVGFVIYSIYNLTSLSIYKDYDYKVAIFDTIWGTFLNTVITFVYFLL